jgi:GNAT superfamily N-acetyltransferase
LSRLEIDKSLVSIKMLLQGHSFGEFVCENTDYTAYVTDGSIYRDVASGVSQAYIAVYGEFTIGYITLSADAIVLHKHEGAKGVNYYSVPAVKVGRLAVALNSSRQGVGELLLSFAVGLVRAEVSPVVGCRYITLDSLPERVQFYKKRGFKENKRVQSDYKLLHKESRTTKSLRYDIMEQGSIGGPQ